MALFPRDEIDDIVAEAWKHIHDGSVSQHLSKLRRHLQKFDSLKKQSARDEHWKEAELAAYRIRKRLDILRNFSGQNTETI